MTLLEESKAKAPKMTTDSFFMRLLLEAHFEGQQSAQLKPESTRPETTKAAISRASIQRSTGSRFRLAWNGAERCGGAKSFSCSKGEGIALQRVAQSSPLQGEGKIRVAGEVVQIFWLVLRQSARKRSRPKSVRGWWRVCFRTAKGTVAMSAPTSAARIRWVVLRTDATSTSAG